jgi:hypothetical protein
VRGDCAHWCIEHRAHTLLTPTVLKLGVAPRVQLEIASSFIHHSGTAPDYSGIGDASAALKWGVAEKAPVIGDYALDINAGYTRRSGDGSKARRNATLWTVSGGKL